MGLSIGWHEYLGLVLNQKSITTLSLYSIVQESNVGVGLANQVSIASIMIRRGGSAWISTKGSVSGLQMDDQVSDPSSMLLKNIK